MGKPRKLTIELVSTDGIILKRGASEIKLSEKECKNLGSLISKIFDDPADSPEQETAN